MAVTRTVENELILGLVSVSDRASAGVYADEGLPALEDWIRRAVTTPVRFEKRLIPDERHLIENTLRDLVDNVGCDLVLTTGGTGPALRDVTPEATLAVATREMPGFGEQMRRISLAFVPTAILSRQVGVLREIPGHAALILNLPGRPKAIAETLGGAKNPDGSVKESGIFAAVPYCIDLIGGPRIETDEAVVKAFRPKLKTGNEASKAAAPESGSSVAATAAAPRPAETMSGFKPHQNLATESNAPSSSGLSYTAPRPSSDDRPRMSREAIERRSVQRGVPLFNEKRPVQGAAPLRCFVKEPVTGENPACTVVWLHGMGTTVKDFEPFAQEVADFGGPAARFVFPQAPKLALTLHRGWETTAWYDVLSSDFTSVEDERGIRAMHLRISQVIRELTASGTPADRIFLGGFSMGGAMALFSGLRQPQPIAGVIALSGYLPLSSTLATEITPAGRRTPVFMGHGVFDDVINPLIAKAGAKVIESQAETLIWREYNMEHTLAPEEMEHVVQFMQAALEH